MTKVDLAQLQVGGDHLLVLQRALELLLRVTEEALESSEEDSEPFSASLSLFGSGIAL